jgi:S1-C subfamily serine protease
MLKKFGEVWLPALATLILGIALGVGVIAPVRVVQGDTIADSETELLRGIYAKVNPSVVSIDVRIPNTAGTTNDLIPQDGSLQGAQQPFAYAAGSGFLYDTQGHIVTNAHVVQGTDTIEVTFSDDTQMRAKIVGIDLDSDIAVIKVEGNVSKYQPLELANSDELVVGDRAVAIGNPFQEAGTMTTGIISGLHRSVIGLNSSATGSYTIPDAIQTDAAVNPGNSGGPLLNSEGKVIGVNEQIASTVRQSSGVSFAIPSNLTKLVADALIKDGKVEYAWLGISGTSLGLEVNEAMRLATDTRGILVGTVEPGSPAAKGGLKGGTNTVTINGQRVAIGGDVIVALNGQPVKHFEDLASYIFSKVRPGDSITVTVLRNGQQHDLSVTLAPRPRDIVR